MCPDSEINPEDDIQQAIQQAQSPSLACSTDSVEPQPGEVMVEASRCPLMRVKGMMSKCGVMAAKYPWQTTLVLLLVVGCGWICVYFGITVLAALVLFAIFSDV